MKDRHRRSRIHGHAQPRAELTTRLGRIFAVIVSTVLAGSIWLNVPTASASASETCTAGFYYAGETLNAFTYAGIERYISNDTLSMPTYTGDHAIDYLAAEAGTSYCVTHLGLHTCHIQIGYGVGHINKFVARTTKMYMEGWDIYGYTGNFYTFSMTLDAFSTVYWTGTTRTHTGHVLGLFDAYQYGLTHKLYLLGQVWLNYYRHIQPQAISENSVNSHQHCPVVPKYQYFGTTFGGLASPGYTLDYYSQSRVWTTWPSTSSATHVYHGTLTKYHYTNVQSYRAFSVWGGT